MLFGVLRMPYEMAMDSELSRFQFYQRAQEAADRLEALSAPAVPETADTAELLRLLTNYQLGGATKVDQDALYAHIDGLLAQQREAGRAEIQVELLDTLTRLATVQNQLIAANAEIIAANAGMHPTLATRQPVAPDLASLLRYRAKGFGVVKADGGPLVHFADVERLLSHSAQSPALDLSRQVNAIRSAFYQNMLRAFPGNSHEEITEEINKAIGAALASRQPVAPTGEPE